MKQKETIHIGNLIREKLKQEERSGAWLARKLCMDASNISKILQHHYIDTELLMRISVILHENFFDYYCDKYKQTLNIDNEEITSKH